MKSALITGASSGLGLEISKKLKGYRLLLESRTTGLQVDLSKDRTLLINQIHEEVPELVINCAGYGEYGPAIMQDLDQFEVNAQAAIEITLEAAKALRRAKKRGIIVNVSSAASLVVMPYMALYSASKATLNSFSQSLDSELAPFGIRILVSLPGQIDTSFAEKASQGKIKQKASFWVLKKEDVAKAILKQIEKKKSFQIIDWRYALATRLARLFPKLSTKMVIRSLKRRFWIDRCVVRESSFRDRS